MRSKHLTFTFFCALVGTALATGTFDTIKITGTNYTYPAIRWGAQVVYQSDGIYKFKELVSLGGIEVELYQPEHEQRGQNLLEPGFRIYHYPPHAKSTYKEQLGIFPIGNEMDASKALYRWRPNTHPWHRVFEITGSGPALEFVSISPDNRAPQFRAQQREAPLLPCSCRHCQSSEPEAPTVPVQAAASEQDLLDLLSHKPAQHLLSPQPRARGGPRRADRVNSVKPQPRTSDARGTPVRPVGRPPRDRADAQRATPPKSEWVEYTDKAGRPYFYNVRTKQTRGVKSQSERVRSRGNRDRKKDARPGRHSPNCQEYDPNCLKCLLYNAELALLKSAIHESNEAIQESNEILTKIKDAAREQEEREASELSRELKRATAHAKSNIRRGQPEWMAYTDPDSGKLFYRNTKTQKSAKPSPTMPEEID